mmetsp:Transcript_36476/g.103026  ORF Transcript_36476/g.103026 Transcript_36476/m.103026 type:complete len:627 (-) Transcript_36476:99-1979(-)
MQPAGGRDRVWLPASEVWAEVGAPETSRGGNPPGGVPGTRGKTGCPPATAATAALCRTAAHGHEVIVVSSDSSDDDCDGKEPETGSRDELPHCPICLTDILDPMAKAVVHPCLHVFCRPCVHRWLLQKKLCPLCKTRVDSYLYAIKSERQFSEHHLPPSPPSETARLQGTGWSGGSQWAARRSQGPTSRSASVWSIRDRPGSRNRPEHGRPGGPSSSREPRPYYWRVQRGCQRPAGTQDPAANSAAGSTPRPSTGAPGAVVPIGPSLVQRAMLWRRRIYAEDLWARGLSRCPPRRPADDVIRQQRLREWVLRELKAILRHDDVSFLTMYFLGLWASHGPGRSSAALRSGGYEDSPLRGYLLSMTDPAQRVSNELLGSIAPFLGSDSLHFWHELKCFALSGFPVPTYDNIASYCNGEAGLRELAVDRDGLVVEPAASWPAQTARPSRRAGKREAASERAGQRDLEEGPQAGLVTERLRDHSEQPRLSSAAGEEAEQQANTSVEPQHGLHLPLCASSGPAVSSGTERRKSARWRHRKRYRAAEADHVESGSASRSERSSSKHSQNSRRSLQVSERRKSRRLEGPSLVEPRGNSFEPFDADGDGDRWEMWRPDGCSSADYNLKRSRILS